MIVILVIAIISMGSVAAEKPGSAIARDYQKEIVNIFDKIQHDFEEKMKALQDVAMNETIQHPECPASHPYAFNGGYACCKYDKEGTNTDLGESCDGGKISLDSKCCQEDKKISCPVNLNEDPCTDFNTGKAVSLECAVGNMTSTFHQEMLEKQILNISIIGCEPGSYEVEDNTVRARFQDCARNITQGPDVITQENIVAVVTGTRDPKMIVERVTVLYFKLECKFNRRLNVTLGAAVNVVDRKELFKEAKITNFGASMMAYKTSAFVTLAPSPLKVTADDPIFMQIIGIHHNTNFKFITEDCFATPSTNPKDSLQYLFFASKCPLDSTFKEINPNTKNKFSFSINAFTFIHIKKHVYFHCSLLICRINSDTKECTQTCESNNGKREIMEAEGGIERITVQSGAIEWKSKSEDVQVANIKDEAKSMSLDAQIRYVEDEISTVMDEYTK